MATFEKLFEEDPNYADADSVYFELGWALKLDKQPAEAARIFARLADEFPDHSLAVDSQYLVGDYAYEREDYKEAAVAYHVAMTKAGKS